VTLQTVEYPKARIRYKDWGNTIDFVYVDDTSQNKTYQFSELVDEDDIAWSDLPTLLEWLRANTGNGVRVVNDGSIDVNIQDSTSPKIIAYFNNIEAEELITVTGAIDDTSITVSDGTLFTTGQYVIIFSVPDNRFTTFRLISKNVNVLNLDTPLDFAYPIGSFVSGGQTNMAVDGSVTPRVFGVRNTDQAIGASYDISRLMFAAVCDGTLDLSKFADQTALLKGFVIREKDGVYRNLFNIKSNAEMDNLMFDFKMITANGQAKAGFVGRFTLTKLGALSRLRPGEDLQCIIQDDLSGILSFEIQVQGSEVVN